MAKDITIKSPDGTMIYYPKTVSQLVYDNENGNTVKQDIDSLEDKCSDFNQTLFGTNWEIGDSGNQGTEDTEDPFKPLVKVDEKGSYYNGSLYGSNPKTFIYNINDYEIIYYFNANADGWQHVFFDASGNVIQAVRANCNFGFLFPPKGAKQVGIASTSTLVVYQGYLFFDTQKNRVDSDVLIFDNSYLIQPYIITNNCGDLGTDQYNNITYGSKFEGEGKMYPIKLKAGDQITFTNRDTASYIIQIIMDSNFKILSRQNNSSYVIDEDGWAIFQPKTNTDWKIEIVRNSKDDDKPEQTGSGLVADVKYHSDMINYLNGKVNNLDFDTDDLILSKIPLDSPQSLTINMKGQTNNYLVGGLSMNTDNYPFDKGDIVRFYCKFNVSGTITGNLNCGVLYGRNYYNGNPWIKNFGTSSGEKVFDYTMTLSSENYKSNDSINYGISFGFNNSATDSSNVDIQIVDCYIENKSKGFVISYPFGIINRWGGTEWGKKYLKSGDLTKPTHEVKLHFDPRFSQIDNRPLRGKQIYFFGDSITSNGGWQDWVSLYTGAYINNFGDSGASPERVFGNLSGWGENWQGSGTGVDLSHADAVAIMVGTNGGAAGSTLYTDHDVWDLPCTIGGTEYNDIQTFIRTFCKNSFANVTSAFIQYIKYKKPNCKVYIITPPPSSDKGKAFLYNRFIDSRVACEWWHVYQVNALQSLGITYHEFIDTYSQKNSNGVSDKCHPNEIGKRVFGQQVGKLITNNEIMIQP